MDLKRLPGEKDLCVTTVLDGVQVTLGDILTANVTGKRDRSTPPIVQHSLYYNSHSTKLYYRTKLILPTGNCVELVFN